MRIGDDERHTQTSMTMARL